MQKNLGSCVGAAALAVAAMGTSAPALALPHSQVMKAVHAAANVSASHSASTANSAVQLAALSRRAVDGAAAHATSGDVPAEDLLASREKKPVETIFDAGHVPFTVHIGSIEANWSTMSTFVLPGAAIDVSATGGSGSFSADADTGSVVTTAPGSWRWTAPAEHGDHQIRIHDTKGTATAVLQVFVLVPYDGSGQIGSYRIGSYRPDSTKRGTTFTRPAGMIEVTAQNIDTRLSPHFRLGQFLCKDDNRFPKYVALQTPLLVKLETLMEALADRGLPAETLHVMSGFRTPAYNAGIGNETTYSRHTYGDAADVFLDRDGDGKMDDLDHDGQSTVADAQVLYHLVEDVIDTRLPDRFVGGLSAYKPTPSHGPFVHIDTRGTKARW